MYATLETLLALQPREVLLQLADDNNDGEFLRRPRNAAYGAVLAAINEASTLIDSYISGRYGLPLDKPYPDLVVEMCSHLALCALYDRRRELDVPEGIKERRGRYMALLKDIQQEKASIPGLRRPRPAASLVSSTPREFGDSLLTRM